MSTRYPHGAVRPRSLAAFCTAVLAAASLALLPALPAAADDLTDLTTAAQEARAAADAAHATAAQAQTDAAAAAESAASARAAADSASATATTAADALAASPDDPALQTAAAEAQAAFEAADAAALTAEAAAAEAEAAAAAALATAQELEAAAVAAEEALAAANPPAEETVEEPSSEVSSERMVNNCNDVSFSTYSQDTDRWGWCFPDPEIDIDVTNVCPIEVVVSVEHLWFAEWLDYSITVNGVEQQFEIDKWGKTSFTVAAEEGAFEVKVYRGDHKVAYEHEWLWQVCPNISTDVEHECKVIGGDAEVEVRVADLDWWRTYDIVVSGPNGDETFQADWTSYWEKDLYLVPGDYTVTVTSEGWKHVPALGPVTYQFTVAPCPGEVVITITPTCSTNDAGSLGATLSGLVIGREYWVTVEGPGGVVTDVTFIADATTWAVPPAHLPPGTYTVTVVDTQSYDIEYAVLGAKYVDVPEYDPLTWTATGTISSCPALAHTGEGPSSQLLPALALVPIGAGLMVAGAVRRRRPLMEAEEE
ncbi:hypothetical protein PYV02_00390 [Leifsonia sp. H3M29-4]|uniref:hypothetical protein n=1 Tax=Salinibacterium metalliresistens TaxID=3031321 RepID=UPI0023DA9D9B|nr:hypothetical protein [Salinibacterium metalliresistens]MDF1477535.1 hypothetical protein [Salinibacterium metalliresistens]